MSEDRFLLITVNASGAVFTAKFPTKELADEAANIAMTGRTLAESQATIEWTKKYRDEHPDWQSHAGTTGITYTPQDGEWLLQDPDTGSLMRKNRHSITRALVFELASGS
jgi:hypothetical protein